MSREHDYLQTLIHFMHLRPCMISETTLPLSCWPLLQLHEDWTYLPSAMSIFSAAQTPPPTSMRLAELAGLDHPYQVDLDIIVLSLKVSEGRLRNHCFVYNGTQPELHLTCNGHILDCQLQEFNCMNLAMNLQEKQFLCALLPVHPPFYMPQSFRYTEYPAHRDKCTWHATIYLTYPAILYFLMLRCVKKLSKWSVWKQGSQSLMCTQNIALD